MAAATLEVWVSRGRRMRVFLDTVAFVALGLLIAAITMLAVRWPFANTAAGELRCDDGGAVVVRVAGKDYAVNGMASRVTRLYSKFGTTIAIQTPTLIA